jgi:hypothetical protein
MDFNLLSTKKAIRSNLDRINVLFNQVFESERDAHELSWRLLENPLGKSLVIIAEDKGEIVLARVFWCLGNDHYQCIDTVIHPLHQGQGLFRMSHNFVLEIMPHIKFYNLPNARSFPVYIRLGWEELPSTYIKLILVPYQKSQIPEIEWNYNTLKWRYGDCPNRRYYYSKLGKKNIIFFYKKGFFPIVLGSTTCNLDFLVSKSILFGFSYDENICGLPYLFRKSKRLHFNANSDFKSNYFLYDMF